MAGRPPSDGQNSAFSNRTPARNPLLSNAVTGLSIDDLMRSAVLVPAQPTHVQEHAVPTPASDTAGAAPVPPAPSEDLPSTKDDFDVNTYLERLRVSRYVSAPKTVEASEDAVADEEFSDVNLDTSNEDDQGLASDLAQNISQLPQVLPHVASAVFSSFASILRGGRESPAGDCGPANRSAAPSEPANGSEADAPPANPVPLLDAFQFRNGQSAAERVGAKDADNHFRINAHHKKTYAQIPGLRLGEMESGNSHPSSLQSVGYGHAPEVQSVPPTALVSNVPPLNIQAQQPVIAHEANTLPPAPGIHHTLPPTQNPGLSVQAHLPEAMFTPTHYRSTSDLVPKVPYAPKGYLTRKPQVLSQVPSFPSVYDPSKYKDNVAPQTSSIPDIQYVNPPILQPEPGALDTASLLKHPSRDASNAAAFELIESSDIHSTADGSFQNSFLSQVNIQTAPLSEQPPLQPPPNVQNLSGVSNQFRISSKKHYYSGSIDVNSYPSPSNNYPGSIPPYENLSLANPSQQIDHFPTSEISQGIAKPFDGTGIISKFSSPFSNVSKITSAVTSFFDPSYYSMNKTEVVDDAPDTFIVSSNFQDSRFPMGSSFSSTELPSVYGVSSDVSSSQNSQLNQPPSLGDYVPNSAPPQSTQSSFTGTSWDTPLLPPKSDESHLDLKSLQISDYQNQSDLHPQAKTDVVSSNLSSEILPPSKYFDLNVGSNENTINYNPVLSQYPVMEPSDSLSRRIIPTFDPAGIPSSSNVQESIATNSQLAFPFDQQLFPQTQFKTTGDLVPKVPYAPRGYMRKKSKTQHQATLEFYDPTKFVMDSAVSMVPGIPPSNIPTVSSVPLPSETVSTEIVPPASEVPSFEPLPSEPPIQTQMDTFKHACDPCQHIAKSNPMDLDELHQSLTTTVVETTNPLNNASSLSQYTEHLNSVMRTDIETSLPKLAPLSSLTLGHKLNQAGVSADYLRNEESIILEPPQPFPLSEMAQSFQFNRKPLPATEPKCTGDGRVDPPSHLQTELAPYSDDISSREVDMSTFFHDSSKLNEDIEIVNAQSGSELFDVELYETFQRVSEIDVSEPPAELLQLVPTANLHHDSNATEETNMNVDGVYSKQPLENIRNIQLFLKNAKFGDSMDLEQTTDEGLIADDPSSSIENASVARLYGSPQELSLDGISNASYDLEPPSPFSNKFPTDGSSQSQQLGEAENAPAMLSVDIPDGSTYFEPSIPSAPPCDESFFKDHEDYSTNRSPFDAWRCNYPIPDEIPYANRQGTDTLVDEKSDLENKSPGKSIAEGLSGIVGAVDSREIDTYAEPPSGVSPAEAPLASYFDSGNRAADRRALGAASSGASNKTDDEKVPIPDGVQLFDPSIFGMSAPSDARDGSFFPSAPERGSFFRLDPNETSFFDDDRRKFDRDKMTKQFDRCVAVDNLQPIIFAPVDSLFACVECSRHLFGGDLFGRVMSDEPAACSTAVAADLTEASAPDYKPINYHWFFRKDEEGRSVWRPMSTLDSNALEAAFHSPSLSDSTIVSTDGGRFDVHLKQRKRTSVYWNDKTSHVRRCSWFYKGSADAKFVPYPESIADMLEAKYKSCMKSGEWHQKVDLPDGESVMLHSMDVIIHFLQNSSPDTWGSAPPNATRPRVVKRGLEDVDADEGESMSVDHLLLLVHGVGSVCDLRFRTVEEVVDEFRSLSLQLVQSHYKSAYEEGTIGRIEVLPISWHSSLHSEEVGIDKQIELITLDSIPKLRNFTNDTLLDILFYTSPVFCQEIMNTVGGELNRIYSLFMQRNPTFNGAISLGGHSLGSLIIFDLLCHQKADMDSVVNSAAIFNGKSTEGSHRKETSVKYVVGAAGTGQPFITYPKLHFQPRALFALGSPIGMFECVRGIDALGEDFSLPTCPAFFNIFHPYDPVAYRIEPLINRDLTSVKPVLIPHHKGRKRMHLELKETMARFGTDLRQRFMDSLRGTWSAVYSAALGRPSTPPTADVNHEVVEERLSREETFAELPPIHNCKEESSSGHDKSDEDVCEGRLGKLNGGRRVDYVLQEAPFEVFNEYIFAMASHLCYWESEDTMLLILREIYDAIGVSPDSRVPQPTMTVEVERPAHTENLHHSARIVDPGESVFTFLPEPPKHSSKDSAPAPSSHS